MKAENLRDFLFPGVFNFPVDGTGAVGYNNTVLLFCRGERMDKVIVKVRGEQTGADGETNAIEVVAEGRHFEKNGRHYVLYDDHMEEEPISTVLAIEPHRLRLTRNGAITQDQYFMNGVESTSEYRTPFGSLKMSVTTRNMEIAYGTVSGEIHVDYAMALNGMWQSDNALHITVSPDASEVGRLN